MKGKKRKDKKKRKDTRLPTELPPQGTTSATATTSRFNPPPTEQQVTQPSFVPLPTTSPIDSAQNAEATVPEGSKQAGVDPKLWTVEYVASWLRSKGFNQGICNQFTTNEVDGEVLFRLNDENLKSGIGIEAYGPRLKIMNAINDLFPGGQMRDTGDFFPDEGKGKQRRNDTVPDLQLFWKKMWVDREDPFEQQDVLRDSDCAVDVGVPETCKVLCHLPNVFRYGVALVRKEYEEALEAIKGYEMTQNAVVVVGHPGIGKTIFLYYLLVHRLLLGQPTLFQYEDKSILLFDENGVTRLLPESSLTQSSTSSTWALVDANSSLSKPAQMLLRDGSPFFTVVASSPRSARWDELAHYRPPFKLWFMEPFTLGELIQARHLQGLKRSERELQQFFELYGSSARDCYAFCADISSYHTLVGDKIKSMTWPTITDALKGTCTLQLDEGSHKVILIAPDPENREIYRPRIITKAVASMLCERDTNERWRNAHNLYRSMRLDPKTKSSAGWLLEPPFHALCVAGTTFQIYQMQRTSGGNVSDIFTNVGYTKQQTLTLPPQKLVSFDKSHPINALKPGHYYQPIHGTQPSSYSFIYDPMAPCITMLQVTDGEKHPVKALGISFLLKLAKRLQLPVPKLRFVVVVPEGDQVQLMLPKAVDVPIELFFLEVSEAELFSYW